MAKKNENLNPILCTELVAKSVISLGGGRGDEFDYEVVLARWPLNADWPEVKKVKMLVNKGVFAECDVKVSIKTGCTLDNSTIAKSGKKLSDNIGDKCILPFQINDYDDNGKCPDDDDYSGDDD